MCWLQDKLPNDLRILAGKKHPQIKLQRCRKWTFVWLVHTTLYTISSTKTKVSKKSSSCWQNPALCDRSILYFPFCLRYHLASDRAILYGNASFSILVFSTKKRYSSFLEKGSRFSENLF